MQAIVSWSVYRDHREFEPKLMTLRDYQENAVDASGPPILAANSHSELWSLCPNSTANGRVNVVYAAKANHAHYL